MIFFLLIGRAFFFANQMNTEYFYLGRVYQINKQIRFVGFIKKLFNLSVLQRI